MRDRDAPALVRLASEPRTFVVFTVERVRYALPVEAVQRTLPYPLVTRLPGTQPHVLGAFQVGGRVIALWDLHVMFRAGEVPVVPWVVVTDLGGRPLGLVVGQVDDVLSVTDAALDVASTQAPDAAGPVVRGVLVAPLDEGSDEPRATSTADGGTADTLGDLLVGRVERGAEQLAALHPVHLLDLDAMRRWGGGEAV